MFIIKGISVHVSRADPKDEENYHHMQVKDGAQSNHRNDSFNKRFSSIGHSSS